jgi:hypothetical protein
MARRQSHPAIVHTIVGPSRLAIAAIDKPIHNSGEISHKSCPRFSENIPISASRPGEEYLIKASVL